MDDHLSEVLEESGVDASCLDGTRELLPLQHATEQAQAALATAAVARADQVVQEAGDPLALVVRPDKGALATGVAPSLALQGQGEACGQSGVLERHPPPQ